MEITIGLVNQKEVIIESAKIFNYSIIDLSKEAIALLNFAKVFEWNVQMNDTCCIEMIENMNLGELVFDECMLNTNFQQNFDFENGVKFEFENNTLNVAAKGFVEIRDYAIEIWKTSDENILKLQNLLMSLHKKNIESFENTLVETGFDRHSEAFQFGQ